MGTLGRVAASLVKAATSPAGTVRSTGSVSPPCGAIRSAMSLSRNHQTAWGRHILAWPQAASVPLCAAVLLYGFLREKHAGLSTRYRVLRTEYSVPGHQSCTQYREL